MPRPKVYRTLEEDAIFRADQRKRKNAKQNKDRRQTRANSRSAGKNARQEPVHIFSFLELDNAAPLTKPLVDIHPKPPRPATPFPNYTVPFQLHALSTAAEPSMRNDSSAGPIAAVHLLPLPNTTTRLLSDATLK